MLFHPATVLLKVFSILFKSHSACCELSNKVLYANIPQGVLKLPEVKDLDLRNLLNKRGLFLNFLLRPLTVFLPLEIKCHTVPHLEGLFSGLESSTVRSVAVI